MKLQRLEKRRALAHAINAQLSTMYGAPKTMLTYDSPWQLLVSVILSAQCTDKKVNEITPRLFAQYPTLHDFLDARPEDVEKLIFQSGFYRAKTKNILGAARVIHERYHDHVPQTMKEMLLIPGVARKTANVVLGNAYGVVEGMAIDTHMIRLSQKLGLTNQRDPVKIERDLMKLLPKNEWFAFTYRLINYGRQYCVARPHDHEHCPLTPLVRAHMASA
jgi:endonuclease-3